MIRTKSSRPRWLIVVPGIPRPDHAGGDRRLLELMKRLAERCELYLVATDCGDERDAIYARGLQQLGVRVLDCGMHAGIQALARFSFDAVFFEFYLTTSRLLPLVRALQPNALVIVDSVDVHYLREREAVRLGTLDAAVAARTEQEELAAYRSADITVVVSESERAVLHEAGVPSVEVIPIIVTIRPRPVRERNPDLLFIGGFNHLPNGLAVEWFHESIWPLIRQRVPAACWIIAGSNTPPHIRALDGCNGIRVLGFVPSTDPLLDSAQLSVAPLTYGGGMKVKVCDALAAGVPVITTKWGAQGLEEGRGGAFVVADDAREFADAVVHLLGDADARARMSEAGQRLAAARCTVAAAADAIASLERRSAGRRGKLWPQKRMRAFAGYVRDRIMER